jgi:hypothetical protein
MTKHISLLALALTASLAAGATAAPLGLPRERVQVGDLKPIKGVVLFDKIVVTPDGTYVGWIENVEYIGQTVTQVKVSTDFYRRSTWVFAEHFQYDPRNNVVVTSKAPSWIKRMSYFD